MSRIKRMSPALVVAILALVSALVVPAMAQVATKALTKREVRVVRKVSAFHANRLINRRVPRIARFQANRQITRRAPAVRPVQVSFVADSETSETVFLEQGGIRVHGRCSSLGNARVSYESTADHGVVYKITTTRQDDELDITSFEDWSAGIGIGDATTGAVPELRETINFRGATGTTVTGSLLLARDTGIGQCVIAGTLFVG